MNFERPTRQSRGVPMTSLIDVVFLLLIFFMLSTSFVRTESLELILPGKGEKVTVEKKLMQVYVNKKEEIYINHRPVNEEMLADILKRKFSKSPDLNILLLSGEGVSVQQLVTVMDKIYSSGGKNLSVSNWRPGDKVSTGK